MADGTRRAWLVFMSVAVVLGTPSAPYPRCRMNEELLKLLGGLGATPQDIAARLGAEGIRGQRGSPSFHNPIGRYIWRRLNVDGLIYVPVRSGRLSVVRERTCHTVKLPVPVYLFLDGFHAGAYPQIGE